MSIAYVRINQITGLKAKAKKEKLEIKIGIDNEATQPIIMTFNPDTSLLTSDNVWSLPFESLCDANKHTSINFMITKIKNNGKTRIDEARLSLPVAWFPFNAVVKENYPMRNLIVRKSKCIMADISVHMSNNGSIEFEAPEGKLLVRPAWKVMPTQPNAKSSAVYPGNYNIYPTNQQVHIIENSYAAVKTRPNPPQGIPQIAAGPVPQVFSNSGCPNQCSRQPVNYQIPPQQQNLQQPQNNNNNSSTNTNNNRNIDEPLVSTDFFSAETQPMTNNDGNYRKNADL